MLGAYVGRVHASCRAGANGGNALVRLGACVGRASGRVADERGNYQNTFE